MKIFDWEQAKDCRSQVTYDFIKSVHATNISEEEFVKQYCALPKSTAKSQRYPSRARAQYRRLKEKFGFFGGLNETN